MTDLLEQLRQRLVGSLPAQFEFEPLGGGRFAVLTPFTFDDGDRFPIVLERHGDGWRISDEGGTALHLSYGDVPFSEGNRALLIENVVARHDLALVDWALTREVSGVPDASDLLGFAHAIAQVADVAFLARATVASTFAEDLRAFLRSVVAPSALEFDYFDPTRDPDGVFRADVRMRADDGVPPLLGFGVSSNDRAKDATITLLNYEIWGEPIESMVVFESQEEIGRKPLAQLSNVVGKQFATLVGNEPRIAEHLAKAKVPLRDDHRSGNGAERGYRA